MSSLDIKLRKASRVYTEGDVVSGVVVIESKSDLSHQGLTLTMEGNVNLQLSAKSVGAFEAFYNSVKPVTMISYSIEMAKSGKIQSGKTEIPFEIPLKTKGNKPLYETYHGVFVNIQYELRAEMKRGILSKDMKKVCPFIVEYKDPPEKAVKKPVVFNITPDSIQNIKEKQSIPRFHIKGGIDSTNCCILKPFEGTLRVEFCEATIKSIELQLVRVETCGCAEGYAKEATEIQNIQVAEADVCRGMNIPIYMVFPRLFTCPTLVTTNFKIEFEVNVVIVFDDDHLVTENFPIKLTRA